MGDNEDSHTAAIVLAVAAFCIMDVSINALQGPLRYGGMDERGKWLGKGRLPSPAERLCRQVLACVVVCDFGVGCLHVHALCSLLIFLTQHTCG